MTARPYVRQLAWHPDDGLWVVAVPDLPGCFAHGSTPAEALAQSEAAIAAWLASAAADGLPAPAPSAAPTPPFS